MFVILNCLSIWYIVYLSFTFVNVATFHDDWIKIYRFLLFLWTFSLYIFFLLLLLLLAVLVLIFSLLLSSSLLRSCATIVSRRFSPPTLPPCARVFICRVTASLTNWLNSLTLCNTQAKLKKTKKTATRE